MNVIGIKKLEIPEVKVLSYGKFLDDRGYFSESIRLSDINSQLSKEIVFKQMNESFSKKGVVRGLHFQWNPNMGKLIRTIKGTMYDIALDIRLDSPTFGKAVIYKMETTTGDESNDWIWVPPGFAHGNFFTEDTYIEYVCTGEYAPETEAGISPFSSDIDWSLANNDYLKLLEYIKNNSPLISKKDEKGYTINEWKLKDEAKNFTISKLSG